jgi:DNA-binding GntR family transcriptional regulator
MRVNTTYKKLCKINDDLKNKAIKKHLYKCLFYIEFTDDKHFNYIYKVYKDDEFIKDYKIIDAEHSNITTDTLEQQIKKDYDVSIECVEFDYLSTEQLIYLVSLEGN